MSNLYVEYLKNPEIIWPAIPISIFNVLITIVGAVGNLSIAFLTFKSSRLRSPCNFYLAFLCIADTLNQSGSFTWAYVMTSGLHFIRLESCFWLQLLPMIGQSVGVVLPMMIAINRFVSVFYAVETRFIESFVVCFFHSAVVIFNAHRNVLAKPDLKVNCKTPDPIHAGNSEYFLVSCMAMTITAMVFYSLMWLRVWANGNVNRTTKRTYFAFTIIVVELFFGWLSSSTTKLILKFLQVGSVGTFQITHLNGLFLYLIWSSNALVLFTFSSDYRRALKQEFGIDWWFGKRDKTVKVVSTLTTKTNR